MQKLKWLGSEDTLIRKELGGEKVRVKKGGIIEVSDEMAKSLLSNAYRKQFEVLKGVVKSEGVLKGKISKKK